MLKIIGEPQVFGWEMAIFGMRSPLESWDKSDSFGKMVDNNGNPVDGLGSADLDLMKRLYKAGTDHRKFMRMIHCQICIEAPQYWWMEADTYKVATTKNSTSKMHKIHVHEFTEESFSCDAVMVCGEQVKRAFYSVLNSLNYLREKFNETQDKKYWRALIQLLPTGFNMIATLDLSYETLANMRNARKYHKLTEWHTMVDVIEELPHFMDIVGE